MYVYVRVACPYDDGVANVVRVSCYPLRLIIANGLTPKFDQALSSELNLLVIQKPRKSEPKWTHFFLAHHTGHGTITGWGHEMRQMRHKTHVLGRVSLYRSLTNKFQILNQVF